MDITEQTAQFKSKWNVVLSCLGCAVGTGNIWRFPRILANNSGDKGGLAFIMLWAVFLFLWSIPMLLLEYAIGRFTNVGVVKSFCRLVSDKIAFLGGWVVMVSFFIACYYSVIVGWCFYYLGKCIAGLPSSPQESREIFRDFAEDQGFEPVLCTLLACVLAGLSVFKGVKTIEIVSAILVPFLLLIILCFFCASLFMEHASVGIQFVFTGDWDSIGKFSTWIDALSQNAFDTGAGAGLILSFATYLSSRHDIVQYATLVPILNNFISLVCALTIFGGVFSTMITSYGYLSKDDIVDIIMDSGPGNTGLTFIWLPVLCNTLGGGLGQTVAVFFFLCLSFAGLTTLVSNMELFTRTICDFGVPRKFAMCICTIAMFLIGLPSSLNLKILNNQDFVWAFGLVINGLVFIMVVCAHGAERFRQTVINSPWVPKPFLVFVGLLIIQGVGLILWWAFDLVLNSSDEEEAWDELGERTFVTTILEWVCLVVLLVLANLAYVNLYPIWQRRRTPPLHQQQQRPNTNSGGYESLDSQESQNHDRINITGL